MAEKLLGCEAIENEIRNPRLYRYNIGLFLYYKAFAIVNNFLDLLDSTTKVAIWGAGKHTMMLWHGISKVNREKITCLVDKDPQSHADLYGVGLPVVYPAEVSGLSIDAIIISSYICQKDIEKDINRLDKPYRVLKIYSEVNDMSDPDDLLCNVGTVFYQGVEYTYEEISEGLVDLKNSKSIAQTQMLLKKIIGEYLHIKDFYSAYKYIDQLCALKDEESEYYFSLKERLVENFERIKQNISGKQHIVVNWIDQLVFDDLANMSFLSSLTQKGAFFENAYTQTPYTTPTRAAVFTGGRYLDDLLFKMKGDDYKNSALYTEIIGQGYSFKYFGHNYGNSVFANPNTLPYRSLVYHMQYPCMIYQWEALKEMESNDSKCFLLIHNLYETHTPCLSGMQADLGYWVERDWIRPDEGIGDEKSGMRRAQEIISEKYFDIQFQFYQSIYNDIRANILMSDHGRYGAKRFGEYRYTRSLQVLFAIVGNGVRSRKIKEILSLRRFPQIIQCIFEEKTDMLESFTEKYALIQAEDIYYYPSASLFFKNPHAAEREYIQYRGVISLEDIYVRTVLGDEYYYLQGDEGNNRIAEEKYQDRIRELRERAGSRFVNIYKEPKYVSTRMIYKMLGYKIPDGTEFIE